MPNQKTKISSIALDMFQLAAALLTLSANPQFLVFLVGLMAVLCIAYKYKIFK
ncbi:MAG: hypothetical protein F6K25_10220 [Okeania sp. SIO2G4]|uniref:hypothetical protein n=1 Tax=unclassified Okeania TaxID=2634635 RepID=UPI0013B7644D|nr:MULTISPECIES: hypothetical protein [unclassified Okeania]NEP39073.1 hypothetical protein [Okeania sp. SIO2H7]NEP72084.1 hypothetical protein [Okeania sp. SIO2G5]NEP92942.1 hypothetical protein [Okeania sp. SIO2F5]NEQ91062.1 hypothetical protein [Okeania sp. SIO2G4]